MNNSPSLKMKSWKMQFLKVTLKQNTYRTHFSLLFLFLFMLWNYFLSLFLAERANLETYEEFCWKVWVKYEPKLPSHFLFYTKNICQIQKIRTEVRADIIIYTYACKAAQLAVANGRNKTTDIFHSNGKAKIDLRNTELAEFCVHTKTFLADSIHKDYCK